ncbi:MAG: ATP-dependent DNA helicase RecG [Clostridia bacterium]|nr:ATP-dependent DNA helicase RecG [Clostridia bacterium]
MSYLTKDSPVSMLSGVGKARAEKLMKLGIETLYDLIYFFPRAYENRGNISYLQNADEGVNAAYLLTVATEVSSAKLKSGLTLSKFRAFDETGSVEVVFFNSPFVKNIFHIGSEFRFYGKISVSKNRIQLVNPKYEAYVEGMALEDYVPIYPLTDGISSKQLDKLVRIALDDVLPTLEDPLPEALRLQKELPTLSYALMNAHFPENDTALRKALRRLAFDEMLFFGIGIALSAKKKRMNKGVKFSPCSLSPLTELLPYELTSAQKNAINDVYKDTVIGENGNISSMARIIVGDVGSGKTICAVAAMYIAYKSSYQSALMVPTEILARQHYKDVKELLSSLGISCELILGSTTQKEKKRIYESVASGETDILIGTHAIISDKLSFKNLGLVITDEQHRFGVRQRALLKEKSESAHLLVMSATPIPRTLALAMYGDLDVSRINEMPKGRQRVDTYVVNEEYRKRLNEFIRKQVSLGGQCYIVCPAIEADSESDDIIFTEFLGTAPIKAKNLNLKNAVDYTEELKAALPDIRIATLHGKMKPKEKDEIMSRFAGGELDVLVSTTVIEVGVNVPNATLMVIENAERFGLSALHQLRGRVGRGQRKSYCVLVSDINSDKATARLNVMKTTYDGYEIAEKDLFLRGPGDFLSHNSDNNFRQSGGFEFRFASMCDDSDLFQSAFSAAKSIVDSDPLLEDAEHLGLRSHVENYLKVSSSFIS